MLQNMHIKNLVLIDEIDIDFDKGLNILTGETGAGKSIIIGSLGICLGGKFPKELLRNENSDGLVELLFTVESDTVRRKLRELEIEEADEEVLISRRLNPTGKVVNRINGSTVTVSKLKETASVLIDLHAQHEQQTLLKPLRHIQILDEYGGEKIQKYINSVCRLYNEYIELTKELSGMSVDENEKNKKMDYLMYQINEIENANLVCNEDIELETYYKKANNSKCILDTANEIYAITGYDSHTSAGESIGHALTLLSRIKDLDDDLSDSLNMLTDIDSMLNDFNREFKDYMKSMEFDEEQFKKIESRLDFINSLKAKYGNSIQEILQSLDGFKEEYELLLDYDSRKKKIEGLVDRKREELSLACDELTSARKKVAKDMCDKIRQALLELNFESVQFDMEFSKADSFSSNGNDEAHFVISTNVGEPMRPLYDVASGGELSRVMLAIKSSLANADDTPSLVFDEIDVGISGRTAQKVAEQIAVIGKNHQVICITHLPQIAAMAKKHFLIEKKVENNKTITNIRSLDYDGQIDEIARLLGGAKITEVTIDAAKEMKNMAYMD